MIVQIMEIKDLTPLVTAGVAWYVANTWRAQTTGKRRIEVAENALMLFYEARDAIAQIRGPLAFSSEEMAGEQLPAESAHVFHARKRASVPYARYLRYSELFGKLSAARYQFGVAFGVDAMQPFSDIRIVVTHILSSAETLGELWSVRDFDPDDPEDQRSHRKAVKEHEAVIWRRTKNDEISDHVEKIVERVEQICRPVLSHATLWQRFHSFVATAVTYLKSLG
jgi:hypothetical protein